ncbi:uncharacterized protein BO80DRAFT_178299 [Aspergillus ibericus CBS 121593]|uniref:Secreted protein n=1 Tax=Aspergillus ibericus CBS 121593 TaxID=1448316 RepID=A0A395HDH7_9EURO|nr:hypothetical protein BO80DRAFT_178299 [Aspergillus ibericus CBS 121593]RAL05155.1 hypothetical protein BO80DRAFT_178299 [Aspergillus ibericus CBS 121593]
MCRVVRSTVGCVAVILLQLRLSAENLVPNGLTTDDRRIRRNRGRFGPARRYLRPGDGNGAMVVAGPFSPGGALHRLGI